MSSRMEVLLGIGSTVVQLTIRAAAKRDEQVERSEDDIGLHKLVVVQLSQELDPADPTLIHLGPV